MLLDRVLATTIIVALPAIIILVRKFIRKIVLPMHEIVILVEV